LAVRAGCCSCFTVAGAVMSFGQASKPRHTLEPSCDRSLDTRRGPPPPVPRAPRAKPRANSAGALARDQWGSTRGRSVPSSARSTEDPLGRSREASPFATFARVSLLNRERDSVECQQMEMGPRKKIEKRTDFSKGHALGKGIEANSGIPWSSRRPEEIQARDPARRNVLEQERVLADQALEWAPKVELGPCAVGRRNELLRENVEAEESREWGFGKRNRYCGQAPTGPGAETGYHGRRDILAREQQDESTDMPGRTAAVAEGSGSAVPSYHRRSMLPPAQTSLGSKVACR